MDLLDLGHQGIYSTGATVRRATLGNTVTVLLLTVMRNTYKDEYLCRYVHGTCLIELWVVRACQSYTC